ncbi:MAG: hypothetical protein ACO1RX_21545 [Candidatus Sericytochromatia bacterium]
MVEQVRVVQQVPLTQQLEPLFGEIQMGARSLRKQARPTPPEPDFTQDILSLSQAENPTEHHNILSFRRHSAFSERQA